MCSFDFASLFLSAVLLLACSLCPVLHCSGLLSECPLIAGTYFFELLLLLSLHRERNDDYSFGAFTGLHNYFHCRTLWHLFSMEMSGKSMRAGLTPLCFLVPVVNVKWIRRIHNWYFLSISSHSDSFVIY